VTVKGPAQMGNASAMKAIVVQHAMLLVTPVDPVVRDGTALTAHASARVELTTCVLDTERVIGAPMVMALVHVTLGSQESIVQYHALAESSHPALDTEYAMLKPPHAFAVSSFQEVTAILSARAIQGLCAQDTDSVNGVRSRTECVCVVSATLHTTAARAVPVGQQHRAMGTACATWTKLAHATEICRRASGARKHAPPARLIGRAFSAMYRVPKRTVAYAMVTVPAKETPRAVAAATVF